MKQADAKFGVLGRTHERTRTRRSYTLQFKRDVVAQCLEPSASVSAIALSHGINANVIRKWLPRHRDATSTAVATMLPVMVAPAGLAENPQSRMPMPVPARPPIELILNQATVRLPIGFDPAELHSIVQILAALR